MVRLNGKKMREKLVEVLKRAEEEEKTEKKKQKN